MKKRKHYFIWYILFFFFLLIGYLKLTNTHKVFLNLTPSVSMGIYLLDDYNHKDDLKKGTYILFVPPKKATKNRVYYNPFLKKIVGDYRDEIIVSDSKIYINDEFMGEIQEKDSYGNSIRRLQPGKQILLPGEYFVMGEHENSYDSRYWGSIKKEEILLYGKLFIPFPYFKK